MSRTKHHGGKAKQKEFGDNWCWMQSTPGWWIRLMMQKPQRRLASVWQRNAEKSIDVSDIDKPPHGRKPHWYFW